MYHYRSQIEGCNVTAPNRTLYSYTPNVQFLMRESDKHIKTLYWFTRKVYSQTLFKVVVGKGGTEYGN